jgi:hypothetical protein
MKSTHILEPLCDFSGDHEAEYANNHVSGCVSTGCDASIRTIREAKDVVHADCGIPTYESLYTLPGTSQPDQMAPMEPHVNTKAESDAVTQTATRPLQPIR